MSTKGFTHLHLHSQYSLLDGAINLDRLLKRCKELEMGAVAVTDHGNMFGAIEFYTKALSKQGFELLYIVWMKIKKLSKIELFYYNACLSTFT